jgi:Endoribonuclease L-PSP
MTQNIRTGGVNDLSFINPKGLYDPTPNGYSHLAVFPADWRMILPAGQGGETEDQVLSDDFRTQLKQAVRNTEIVLAAAGAKLSDVAKFPATRPWPPSGRPCRPKPCLRYWRGRATC